MELLPRHERQIKEQLREYNKICNTKLTSRQWLVKIIELGQEKVDDANRQLVTGLIIKAKNK